ncbi:mitochondrial carnitine acylcarnitine carrier [Podospora conica]|nr:mitochondrial carnitine acylcarnitine carrier [Schizothecium conicum]
MSADFWAGYLSGAIGIIIGNPLDVLKVRLQAGPPKPTTTLPHLTSSPPPTPLHPPPLTKSFLTGTAAPILGYGALNALLFVSYNRSLALLSPSDLTTTPPPLTSTFLAGCISGLATWAVSTPTEVIKCRAQLSPSHQSSWQVARDTFRAAGVRGFYHGGAVTAWRDSVGYGFYFWGYELFSRTLPFAEGSAGGVLVCGGLAGVVTWASVFPLDVVKTRVQTRGDGEGAWAVARELYREGGVRPFWRGLGVCSARAFVVNAVQWGVYEWKREGGGVVPGVDGHVKMSRVVWCTKQPGVGEHRSRTSC